jgi:hypothetical protein
MEFAHVLSPHLLSWSALLLVLDALLWHLAPFKHRVNGSAGDWPVPGLQRAHHQCRRQPVAGTAVCR